MPNPGPDRPLRADARRNRARVLAAAESVIATKGATASTNEIARAAGVGIGTVFRHFPTKESLLEAVFVGQLTRLAEEAEALAATADGPPAALFAVFARAVELGVSKRAIVEALSAAGVDVDPLASLAGQALLTTLDGLLASAQRAGAVRADLTVADLISLLVGTSRAVGHAGEDPAVRERLITVVLDGLRARPAGH